MKKTAALLIFINMTLIIMMLTGCWNYREIDKLSIVAGLAIDKGENNSYQVTVEVVDLKSEGKNVKTSSKRIQIEGETIFDSLRNMIKVSGKKLYFSHVKIVIISKEVATEGIANVIDLLMRDSESRLTLHVLISKENRAAELLSQQSIISEIRSFEMDYMIKSQNNISKSPKVSIKELINSLAGEGISAALPAVGLTENEGVATSELSGTAVLKKDKLVGFLDGDETMDYLLVINKVKGGIIVDKKPPGVKEANISFEIFNSKTKVKPEYKDGKLSMNISVESDVSIGELGTTKDFINDKELIKLKKDIENKMENSIKELIEKVQNKYDADIFGFGLKVKQNMPDVWRRIKDNWDQEFLDININVNVKLNIRNTGLMQKPLKVGD